MAKIYSYRKVIDEYTTHALNEPDYKQIETEDRITELCTIEEITYVSVPDTSALPEQSEHIKKTLKMANIDEVMRKKIKKACPHVGLIKQRVIEKIRGKYSINDELNVNRCKIAKEIEADADFNTYNEFVKSCISWGHDEIAKLGL